MTRINRTIPIEKNSSLLHHIETRTNSFSSTFNDLKSIHSRMICNYTGEITKLIDPLDISLNVNITSHSHTCHEFRLIIISYLIDREQKMNKEKKRERFTEHLITFVNKN